MSTSTSTPLPPLIVDCQVFQTPAWHRGMGKYSLELLRTFLAENEIAERKHFLLFNSNVEINEEAVDALLEVAPKAGVIQADLAVPKIPRSDYSVEPVRQDNKNRLDKILLNHSPDTKPDFLIMCLFLDEVCPVFPGTYVNDKILLYYDSIPYLYHERYEPFVGFFSHFYLPHNATTFEADKILTISKTVANDLHIFFGIPQDKIFSIDGASIPLKSKIAKKPKGLNLKTGDFVLMPSGQELRKNNQRAVRAYESFLEQSGHKFPLVITSSFTDEAKKEYGQMSDHLVFTNNVPEAELLWLYQNCRYVYFASEYEGLGLPILEAVDHNKLVACSNISAFREMSPEAFYYFEPTEITSITSGLQEVEQAYVSGVKKQKKYVSIKEEYSWQNTSLKMVSALRSKIENAHIPHKKRLAILIPDPSGFSAIGKVVAESHAWYSRFFEIDYFFDRGPNHKTVRPDFLAYIARCSKIEDCNAEKLADYDAVVYHIGNSEYHHNIIRLALVVPGVVVMHDTNLKGAYSGLLQQGLISPHRFELEEALDKVAGSKSKESENSKFLTSLVNNQKAIVTHSSYAKNAVKAKLVKGIPVQAFHLPVDTPIFSDAVQFNISNRSLQISLAGIIAKVKGINIVESIIFDPSFADFKINIFGFSGSESEQIKKLQYQPNVKVHLNPTDFEFQQQLANTDILLNVRLEYKGETSLTTLEQMRYGGVALVRDFGWYSELPDKAVEKVNDVSDTKAALLALTGSPENILSIRQAALKYIIENNTHKEYAKQMAKLIDSLS